MAPSFRSWCQLLNDFNRKAIACGVLEGDETFWLHQTALFTGTVNTYVARWTRRTKHYSSVLTVHETLPFICEPQNTRLQFPNLIITTMTPRPESTNSYTMPLLQKHTSNQRYPTLSGSPSTQSQSIPIANQLPKTQSELQLRMDEAIAEQKDFLFFSRVVKGISDSQDYIHSHNFRLQNQSLVSHIIHTRQGVEQRGGQPAQKYKDILLDEDDWTPGLSSIDPYPDRAAFLHSVTASALAVAELDMDDEGIFVLDL